MGPPAQGAPEMCVNVVNESPVEGLDPTFLFPCSNGEAKTCLPITWGAPAFRLERAREALLGFPNPYRYGTPARFGELDRVTASELLRQLERTLNPV